MLHYREMIYKIMYVELSIWYRISMKYWHEATYDVICHWCLMFFIFSPAGKDVGAAGVARSSHAGLLRPRPGLRRRHCFLQLQQAWQQLPLWCNAGLRHQLRYLHPGHFSCVCCPGVQSKRNEWEVCCRVSASYLNKTLHDMSLFSSYYYCNHSLTHPSSPHV